MQLSVTLFITGTFCSQLIYGPYSDRLGRRKVTLFGLFIASLGSIFCSIANNALILILARFEPFPHIAGTAGAMYGSQALVGFMVSLVMAAIPLTNQLPLACVFVLLSIVSATIFYFYIK